MKDYIDLNVIVSSAKGKNLIVNYSPLWFRDRLDLESVYKHFYKFGNDYYGNVCVPTFTDIKKHNGRIYDKIQSKPSSLMGHWSEYIWKNATISTPKLYSATHSYTQLEPSQVVKDTHIFSSAFGEDSSFSTLIAEDYYSLQIGVPFSLCCSFLHKVEQDVKVPYRIDLDLEVSVLNDGAYDRDIRYNYFSRVASYEGSDVFNPQTIYQAALEHKMIDILHPKITIYRIRDLYSISSEILTKNPLTLIQATESE